MAPAIVAAYRTVARTHRCGVDSLLADPAIRNEFLSACRAAGEDGAGEKELLTQLLTLRKQSKLPRTRDLLRNSDETM